MIGDSISWMQVVLFLVVIVVFVVTAIVTLLGITGKYEIKSRYLAPLVAGLLIENAAAVFYLFKTIDFSNNSNGVSAFIASLPEAVQADTPTLSRDKILSAIKDAEAAPRLRTEIDALEKENAAASKRVEDIEAKLDEGERHFLVRLVRFHRDASEFGSSLNFTYPPSASKHDLARRFLELLSEIGQYDGPIEADPEKAKEALEHYQTSLGFTQLGWYARPVFDAMVAAHLRVGNSN